MCEVLVHLARSSSSSQSQNPGVLYAHQKHALAWLRHRERRLEKSNGKGNWRLLQCLPTDKLLQPDDAYDGIRESDGNHVGQAQSIDGVGQTQSNRNPQSCLSNTHKSKTREEDFQMLWTTDNSDPLNFFSLWSELKLPPVTNPNVMKCFTKQGERNKECFSFFDSFYRFLVVENEMLCGLSNTPSNVVMTENDQGSEDGNSRARVEKLSDGGFPFLHDLSPKTRFSLFFNRVLNVITLGFCSPSRRRRAIRWGGGGIFGDAPVRHRKLRFSRS